jgi:hypothetical protein
MRRPSPFLQPRPFTLHSRSLHSRPSPPPFTPTLHCAALYPSFCRSSPFTLPPFTPALHCAGLHFSFRRLSPCTSPPFTPAVFSAAIYSRLHYAALHSVPRHSRPSLPLFTAALHCHPSLPPFTAPPFTLHSAALYRSIRYPPSPRRPSLPRSLAMMSVTSE